MNRHAAVLLAGILVWGTPSYGKPVSGGCFCVRSEMTLVRNCEQESKEPDDAYPVAKCQARDGTSFLYAISPGRSRVDEGAPGCDPCRWVSSETLLQRPDRLRTVPDETPSPSQDADTLR